MGKEVTTLKGLPSWREYLVEKGVTTDATPEYLEVLKKQYRKEYQRLYSQQRRKEKKRLEPTLTKVEYRRLKKEARRHKFTSLSGFLKHCAFAYLDKRYICHDQQLIRQYIREINAIGNNINQVVNALHISRDYGAKSYYLHLKAQVAQLKTRLKEHLHTSLPIRDELERLFTEYPETIEYFEKFLANWKSKYPSDDHQKPKP